jgi:hypothetical protein
MGGKRPAEWDKRLFYTACALLILLLTGKGCGSGSLSPLRSEFYEIKGDPHLKKAERYIKEGEFEAALFQNEQCGYPLQHEALFQKGVIYAHPECPFRDYAKARECFENLIADMVQVSPDLYNRAFVFRAMIDQHTESKAAHGKTRRALQEKEEQESAMNAELIDLKCKLRGLHRQVSDLKKQIENLKQVDLNLEEKKLGPLYP